MAGSTSAGVAYVDIRAELSKLGAQVQSGVSKSVTEAEGKLAGRFSSFGKNLGRNLLAGIGITFAAAGVIRFIGSSIDQARQAEESQLKLNQAFKTFPGLANISIDSLRGLNEQLALKTKFDDDAFASGQAVLAQFKLTGRQIQEITPLLADYAARTGMDLPSAATALGRAFLGNTRALKTIGISFKATGNTAKDYTTIVGLLRQKVGGFAAAEGKTFSGRLEILHNQFNEVKESIGRGVLPILSGLANFVVTKIIPGLYSFAKLLKDTFGPVFSSIVATAKTFGKALGPIALILGGTLVVALKALGVVLKPLAPAITAVGIALIAAFVKTQVVAGIEAIQGGILALGLAINAAGGGLAAFKVSMLAALGPALLVAGAVTAVVVSVKAIQRGMAEAKAANEATADSFLKDTIPALLKTGGALQITAEQWRSGPFGSSDIIKTKKIFDDLSSGVIGTTEAFRRLKDIAGVTQDAIDAVVKAQIDSAVAAAKQKGTYTELATEVMTAVRAAGTSVTDLGQDLRGLTNDQLDKLWKELDKTGISAEALAAIMNEARTNTVSLTAAQIKQNDATEKYNRSVKLENDQVTKLQTHFAALGTAVDHFTKSLDATLGVQLTLEQATATYDQDLAALGQSLKDNGRSFDLNTQRGRDNSQALRTVVGDIEAQIAAQVKAGAIQGTDSAQKAVLLQRLKDLQGRYPALEGQIKNYIGTVKKIPVTRGTKLTVNPKPALTALGEFEADLKAFGGRIAKESRFDIGIGVAATLKTISAQDVNLTANNVYVSAAARAGGGDVVKGHAYIVGEHRPELFVPDTSGTIIPRVSATKASGDVITLNVYNPVPESATDSLAAFRRRQQILRGN